jgi:hypothetical protein
LTLHSSYNIKRFGEAGSVDLAVVEDERKEKCRILSRFAERDRWNVDETSFFPSAPPDRSLSTIQMSGKKQSKFRITATVCTNADGSEKFPLHFIGKYKRPRCFNKKDPARMRPPLLYRANKKAWMTSELFSECVQIYLFLSLIQIDH